MRKDGGHRAAGVFFLKKQAAMTAAVFFQDISGGVLTPHPAFARLAPSFINSMPNECGGMQGEKIDEQEIFGKEFARG